MSQPDPDPDAPKTHDFAVQSPDTTESAPAALPTASSKKSVRYELALDTSNLAPPPSRGERSGMYVVLEPFVVL